MQALHSLIDLLHANVVLIGLLIGAVTPLLTSVVQQPHWSKRTRTIVAGVVSAVIGLILTAAAGDLSHPADLIGTVSAVIASAEAFYQKLWAPQGIAQAFESFTSPYRGPSGPIADPHDEPA